MFTQRSIQLLILLCIAAISVLSVNAHEVATPVQTSSQRVEPKLSSTMFVGISVDWEGETVFHLSPFYDHAEAVRGLELVGGINLVNSDVNGVQISGILNLIGGELLGVQVSGGANWVADNASYAQASGVLSYVGDEFSGVQVSGGANWVGGDVSFAQIAGVFNYAGSGLSGAQVSGGLNWATDDASYLQVAGLANVSLGTFSGAQISIANMANNMDGAQIGVLNVASAVSGTQIGLINISDRIEGVPLGLFSYARQGSLHVSLWSSRAIPVEIGVKSAFSESLYSLVSLGLTDTSRLSIDLLTGTCGMGIHIPVTEYFYLDADAAICWSPISEESGGSRIQYQGRLLFGVELKDDLSVFIGASRTCSFCAISETCGPSSTVFIGCQLF